MRSFSSIVDLADINMNTFKEQVKEKSIEEQIKEYTVKLSSFKEREQINNLKIEKDALVKEYIYKTKQPNRLNIKLLNYKALLFYFIEKFISDSDSPLQQEDYNNALENEEFNTIFGSEKTIFIHTKYTNFPHLVGYKEDEEYTNKDNNKKFLEKIFYQVNLIKDYSEHGCKLDKIETFSWIWNTLNKPLYIFDDTAIKDGSKLNADIIFVSKRSKWNSDRTDKKNIFHYVSLVNINKEKNIYAINSHHPSDNNTFNLQFDIKKRIYEAKFEQKKRR